MTGLPAELREILLPSQEETNNIWNKEVVPQLSPDAAATEKTRSEPFSPGDARRHKHARARTTAGSS
ncbi:hypothetical protein [Streptomyces peucetius]